MIDVLIPLRINNDKRIDMFKICFESYYRYLKDLDVKYIVCDESIENYHKIIESYLNGFDINYRFINNKGKAFYDAISILINSVTSKYFLFIMDDVELYDKRDIIKPCIEILENRPDLLQIKLGFGSLLENANKNIQGEKAFIGPVSFHSIDVKNEKIWITDIKPELFSIENYLFSYWNNIMRSDFFIDYDNIVMNNRSKGKSNSFHDYAHIASYFVPSDVYSHNYKVGWINFNSYVYPWYNAGFGNTREEWFNRTR